MTVAFNAPETFFGLHETSSDCHHVFSPLGFLFIMLFLRNLGNFLFSETPWLMVSCMSKRNAVVILTLEP